MFTTRAADLFRACEKGLQALNAEANAAGDYDAVDQITQWARTIAALAQQAAPTPAPGLALPTSAPQSPGRPALGSPIHPGNPRSSVSRYPQFFRRGDELVKVGKSRKKKGKEYHHRAPRAAVDALLAAVQKAGAHGRVFTAEELLPLHPTPSPHPGGRGQGEGTAVDPIPDYQAYVALAWLRHLGLVEQSSRKGGYTLASGIHLDSTIASAWASLSQRRC